MKWSSRSQPLILPTWDLKNRDITRKQCLKIGPVIKQKRLSVYGLRVKPIVESRSNQIEIRSKRLSINDIIDRFDSIFKTPQSRKPLCYVLKD